MSTTTSPSERVLDHADPVAAFLAAHDRRAAVALPTSGTSAARRWVVRTTDSWVGSFPQVSSLTGTARGSRVWVPGPLSATMNLFAAVHARWTGADRVASVQRATHATLSPAALHRLLDEGAPAGLTVVVAGDRLAPALAARAREAGLRVCHYYGAAELSFVAWSGDDGSLRPFPGVEVAIRDGEVWVRSPYVCEGYDGPTGPLRRDPHGFATVGDRGRLDGDLLTVLGRPGAVTTAGATVHLADVEAELRAAASGELVVVGLPHDRLGSVLAVALTSAADHERLQRVARERLSAGHRPRLWFHVPALPRTSAGKVDRAALTALLEDAPRLVRS
ncbi:MAG: AMP-binding protein [Nocardioidaceae bacterium]